MTNRVLSQFGFCVLFWVILFQVSTLAQSTTNLIVTPLTPVYDANNVSGVIQDAAPGFSFGSLKSNGTAKTDMYFPPSALFSREVTIGEIESISYWTKKSSLHSIEPADWFLVIYTKPYLGDVSSASWYGDRIGTEPYFSGTLTETADAWNQWSTDGPENQLRFFESTAGAPGATFGSYTDPFWPAFKTSFALSGLPYASHEVLYFSVQTGSAWAAGFEGQLDGLRIELTDGSVATVNFEPFLVATTRDACKKDGWQGLKRADGTTFVNQGDCVAYVSSGQ